MSFVSVTQAFNTTTSMGRLTLNVLLSFAQFEREVTGERIRDKVAASKAKGMWMGGNLPLGYDVKDRQLIVNDAEVSLVRRIFERYLELGSVEDLRVELDGEGVRSKAWVNRAGRAMGGRPFSRGALLHLLKNPLYTGRIPHKDKSYPGLHQPIVTTELFEAVRALLATKAANRRTRPTKTASALLKGLLFDEDGQPMSPSFSYGKGGRTFSYYVSAPARQGGLRRSREGVRRVSAPALEALVLDRLGRLFSGASAVPDQLARVQLAPHAVHLLIDKQRVFSRGDLAAVQAQLGATDTVSVEGDLVRISIAVRPVFRGGRTWLMAPNGRAAIIEQRPDATLVKALRNAHALQVAHGASPLSSLDSHHAAASPDDSYLRKLMSLGYLAPDIQQAIIDGRQPPGLTLQRLIQIDLPLAWEDQRRLLGF